MEFDLGYIYTILLSTLKYLPTTLFLGTMPLILGLVIGLVIALIRFFEVPVAAPILKLYVTIFKAVPILLVLLITYLISVDIITSSPFLVRLIGGVQNINGNWLAVLAFTLYCSCSLSEAIRGALLSIPKGQLEAAKSVGLTTFQMVYRILLPQALSTAIPPISNIFIGLMKATSLVSMVSIVDIYGGALIEATKSYQFLQSYIALALIYWLICVLNELGASYLRRRFNYRIRSQ